ncbi:MFS transporter [Actinokineospora soli]|uniref:MFS transporter n=1 Tax=Actinokineospora soli TaxID=1048753 RepID=A0ABW2TY41_9PSEU
MILGVAVAAQAAMSALVYGPPFVLPQLRAEEGLSLTEASTLVVAPMLGMLLTMIVWGALADRFGERLVMTVGMLGSAAAGFAAAQVPGVVGLAVLLTVAGLFSASISAASGRAVLGWFDVSERGLAMGIRQTCTPLGVGIAALTLPPAAVAWGYRGALVVPAVLCLLAGIAVAVLLKNPPRPEKRHVEATGSPYRVARLWRVHAASALLVGPQFIASTFALTYLVAQQGWDAVAAGRWSRSCRSSAPGRASSRASGPTGPAAGCGPCGRSPRSRGCRCCCGRSATPSRRGWRWPGSWPPSSSP